MEKTYTCKIHKDVRVSEEEYGKGYFTCLKCGNDLIPIETQRAVTCFYCNRNFEITHNCVEDKMFGKCPVCKWSYNIQKEG